MHTISHAALTMTPSLSPSFGGSAGYPTEDEALARESEPYTDAATSFGVSERSF
jgi:hypothetical protein